MRTYWTITGTKMNKRVRLEDMGNPLSLQFHSCGGHCRANVWNAHMFHLHSRL